MNGVLIRTAKLRSAFDERERGDLLSFVLLRGHGFLNAFWWKRLKNPDHRIYELRTRVFDVFLMEMELDKFLQVFEVVIVGPNRIFAHEAGKLVWHSSSLLTSSDSFLRLATEGVKNAK